MYSWWWYQQTLEIFVTGVYVSTIKYIYWQMNTISKTQWQDNPEIFTSLVGFPTYLDLYYKYVCKYFIPKVCFKASNFAR